MLVAQVLQLIYALASSIFPVTDNNTENDDNEDRGRSRCSFYRETTLTHTIAGKRPGRTADNSDDEEDDNEGRGKYSLVSFH